MPTLRLPPRIKVLEALGAIADGRVECVNDKCVFARVASSEGDRVYRVYVDVEKGVAYSDDNGTRLRGYVGYPLIAVLMLQGVLPFDERLSEALKGVPWRRLNEKYKRYAIVEDVVKRIASERGVKPEEIERFLHRVMEKLRSLRLKRLESPPLDAWSG
ncbi:hypothetical protein Pyrfu_1616 [Pyrolobus fumarii 1A]|uniref:Uncharacterized protein n=1 Tax=Pyrolobus fumarii (strain DSM 11204 / 1A) TaxID=694429 RepID=G0ECA3_PYRF1|nr:hypothetical protein [Pyrolobus fumarii]AEM39473.1 hypothetical protein Pyrfu_1616 [Pyrolobus fumarii 1A]